jgi:hypothetical protein
MPLGLRPRAASMWSSRSHEDTRSSITPPRLARDAVLRCLIDENPEGEPVIYIDDHALSLQEFGGLLGTYAGWGMRIVLVEEDNSDPPFIETRDLENGEAAHDWR